MNALSLCCVVYVCIPTLFRLIRLLLCIHSSFIISFLPLTPHSPQHTPSACSALHEFVCLESKDAATLSLFHSFIWILIHQRGFLFNNGTRTREVKPTQQIWVTRKTRAHTYTQTGLRTIFKSVKRQWNAHFVGICLFRSFNAVWSYDERCVFSPPLNSPVEP